MSTEACALPAPGEPIPPCLQGRARWDAALLATLLAAAWLLPHTAPGVTFEDAGALCTAAAELGVPHPPGYPVWTLAGGACVRLAAPLGLSAGQALALFSTLCAALCCGALAALARSRGAGLALAAGAGLLPLASATFASQAVVIEVYALACLAQAGVLALALAPIPRPAATWGALGLAAAAHPASLALLPAAVSVTLRRLRSRRADGAELRPWPQTLAACALAAGAGLAAYLAVPLLALRRAEPDWGRIDSLARLRDHLLRAQYRTGLERDWPEQLGFLSEQSVAQLPYALGLGALGALAALGHRAGRWTTLTLLACAAFAAALLAASVNWPLAEQAARFRLAPSYLPLVVVLCATAGLGAVELARSAQGLLARRGLSRAPGLGQLAGLGVLALALVPGPPTTLDGQSDASQATAAETYGRCALAAAPADGLLVVNRLGYGDVLGFPLLHAQAVLGIRPDVLLVDRGRLPLAWYREQLAEHRPALQPGLDALAASLAEAAPDPRSQRLVTGAYLAHLLESGAPLAFTDPPGARVATAGRLAPLGLLWAQRPASDAGASDVGAEAPPLPPPDWLDGDPPSPWVTLHRELAALRQAH